MTIRVMLADDHRMFREVLRTLLASHSDIEITAETGTGVETLAALETQRPDVLVLDIGLPDINGIDVARMALKRFPGVRIVALSGHADRIYIEEMLKAGAQSYVVKSSGAVDLVAAIRAAARGRSFLSTEVTQVLVRTMHQDGGASTPPPSALGKREQEVLRLVAGGMASAGIAAKLGITVATADAHRRNIKRKLGIYSVAELTRYAIRAGLIPP